MKPPLCYVSAAPFVDAPPGQEPAVAGLEVRVLRGFKPEQAWPEERAAEVEILFCAGCPPNLDAFRRLRWVQISSAGFEHLIPFKLPEKGITATNARGIFDCPIAEWNIAMMINLARHLRTMIANQDRGIWERGPQFCGELRDRTVGIWGYGGIGRETARMAKAMGMTVHVLARAAHKSRADSTALPGTGDPAGVLPDRYYTDSERRDFLARLDFLVIALPMTAQTKGLVTEQDLRTLPKGAFLLNAARGPLVEQSGLLAVMRDGHLGGAALDTHYQYPLPADHPLWKFPHAILTPHISGTTFSPFYTERLLGIFRQNAARYIKGEPLLNVVPPADLR